MSKVVAVIQARLGSRRFPGKSLALLDGRPMIQHVIERVQRVGVDTVVVAIPAKDRKLTRFVESLNVSVVLGSENDVLGRVWMAASYHGADVVMRVTGDCPLWMPQAGKEVIQGFQSNPSQSYWSNDTEESGWPDGTDTEVFSYGILTRAYRARSTATTYDLEHVTSWIRSELPAEKKGMVARPYDRLSDLKLSVDTPSDLESVACLLGRGDCLSLEDLMPAESLS